MTFLDQIELNHPEARYESYYPSEFYCDTVSLYPSIVSEFYCDIVSLYPC